MMSKEKRRVPKLRFPGFTEDWEQRKLGEIFEYLQNNTLSRDSLNYKIPNIKNIHYGDILVKFNEILDGSNKDIPYINPDLDLSKFSKSLLRDGDVIFSDTAEDDTVGKAIELQNVNAPFILSGLHTIPCRPLIPFGKGYLGNFFNSNSYRLQIRPLVQGIKVSSISKSALKDTMIKYPKNLDEQEKIGSLFQSITKMITLHQRKLNNLKLKRKALLQKLFPKNGEGYPELRFPGFTDAWEQRKLGDFYTFKNGLNKEKVYFGYGDSIVNFTDVFHNRQIYSSTLKGKVCVNKKELENYKVKEGDLFFTRTSETIDEIGFPAVVMEPMERVVFSGFVLRGRAEKYDPLANIFKSYIFFTDNFRSEMKKKSSMTTRALTSGTALKEMCFSYPKDLEEQTKIGEILLSLDKIITLHQRKLKHLQIQKKSLLQKLFV